MPNFQRSSLISIFYCKVLKSVMEIDHIFLLIPTPAKTLSDFHFSSSDSNSIRGTFSLTLDCTALLSHLSCFWMQNFLLLNFYITFIITEKSHYNGPSLSQNLATNKPGLQVPTALLFFTLDIAD